jgi:hypothetical protein
MRRRVAALLAESLQVVGTVREHVEEAVAAVLGQVEATRCEAGALSLRADRNADELDLLGRRCQRDRSHTN